ncbi:NAD(P)H-binding protein [Ferruginibacter paludis]|uniref:NAD(P)H-binding protein n=1 Tax=Ferruginibacter paludis TaxID=1310417 RepID=UPI0025B3DB83|nr:NAD(P)H-binding protein [Ferruginibacter paludis]MDN3658979.1 NAD(P)H-binding protein [Ferruginibacter paludis]
MKYVITGGAGHIAAALTEKLLKAGHSVTVIGRTAGNLQGLVSQGATAAVGSLEDAGFVTATFAGADAVYTMIPPNFATDNFRQYQKKVASNYIAAIKANNIQHVVVLSSIGAHMGIGAGPVDGLAEYEGLLHRLTDVNIKVLRPSYFMYNLFNMIPLIKNMQIMGANFGGSGEKLVLVHTNDIAAAAAEELLALDFTGNTIRYVAGDERTGADIAAVLSNAINKPGIPWVEFTDEQSLQGMKQAGLGKEFAASYTTMGKALREGKMQEDYWKNHPALSSTKLEDFAKEFAAAYAQQ